MFVKGKSSLKLFEKRTHCGPCSRKVSRHKRGDTRDQAATVAERLLDDRRRAEMATSALYRARMFRGAVI